MLAQQSQSRHQKTREQARRKLAGTHRPRSVAYLHEWLMQLHGRSGIGVAGFARLSHREIESWAGLRGLRVAPHEIDALLYLDDVMLAPPKPPRASPSE